MSKFAGLYDIRDFKQEDTNFILASFLRGVYYGDSWFNRIPKDIFMANYKKVIEALLAPGKCTIKVACPKGETDIIIGYSILSPDYQTVHWVYVKKDWRKNGIGKSLVPAHPLAVTHLTDIGFTLLPKLQTAVFDPFRY